MLPMIVVDDFDDRMADGIFEVRIVFRQMSHGVFRRIEHATSIMYRP